jgi:hypothetical protein
MCELYRKARGSVALSVLYLLSRRILGGFLTIFEELEQLVRIESIL